MKSEIWLNLQLFAEGGEGGGEGATNGEDSGVPGQRSLQELGVPADKIRKRQKKAETPVPKGAVLTAEAQQEEAEPPATADAPTEEQQTAPPTRMSWEEIMADPEYSKEMQKTVQTRLRSAKAAEENLQKMTPAIEVLARKYNMDMDKLDYDALAKAVDNDDGFYEDLAMSQNQTVEQVKENDRQQRATARQQREEQRTLEQQALNQHFARLEEQGKELKKTFPTFDLRTELQDETFARLVSPGVGLSVEDAYHARHRKEIQAASAQVIAQQTAKKYAASIQAGARRPVENGTTGQAASVTSFDYSKASKAEREALKREIRKAASRGEKLYPGR